MDHLIPTRRQDLVTVTKKKQREKKRRYLPYSGFCRSSKNGLKNKDSKIVPNSWTLLKN